MEQLKNALERLDVTIDRLEAALDARLGQLNGALSDTRAELTGANSKIKNAGRISDRLDDIIAEVRDLLAADDAIKTETTPEGN